MTNSDQHRRVEQWFEEYHEVLLRRLSAARPSYGDVKDLAQEVFLRVLRVSDPELIRHPQAYLLRIAAHVLEEWQQRGHRFVSTSPEQLDALPGAADPSCDLAADGRAKRINAALLELPPLYRSAIVLRAQYGFTVAEVAVKLGISERRVKRHIEKGYAKLRHRLASDRHRS